MESKRQEMTAAEWQDRAVALAEARNLTGTARYIGYFTVGKGLGWQAYRVPSTDRAGNHIVELHENAAHPDCGCTAANYGNPCCHAGAVIHRERQRAAAIANPERIYDTWDKWGEW